MRTILIGLAVVGALTIALVLCARPATKPAKTANLILYNQASEEVAKFIMEIHATEEVDQKLSGNLSRDWASPKFTHGDACGKRFTGELHHDDYTADLNPGTADNNVVLGGKRAGNKITGEWSFCSFVGSKTQGKFELTISAE